MCIAISVMMCIYKRCPSPSKFWPLRLFHPRPVTGTWQPQALFDGCYRNNDRDSRYSCVRMLTRRENLLIRPWQERRYINHRIKVETALPVIDNRPPPYRQHVANKMKKFQKEKERCCQIVYDNFTLLQHLGYITRTCRIDNAWDEPPPNFLNRVGIYSCRRSTSSEVDETDEVLDETDEVLEDPKNRRERCYGCSPHRFKKKVQIPEERIPFAPPKKKLSRKLQSPPEIERKQDVRKTMSARPAKKLAADDETDPEKAVVEKLLRARRRLKRVQQETQSLQLSRGGLTLRVRFPADSGLIFNDKGQARVFQRERCYCTSRKP